MDSSHCTYIASLGKLWGSEGLHDLLADSGVYAPLFVDQMLAGNQYIHAVRGFALVYEALTV